MNPRVKSVKCLDDSTLDILFSNGERKLFDFSPYFKYPVYQKLQNVTSWHKAAVKFGTVAWDNETDFDPDTLYLEGLPHTLQPIH